MSPGRPAGRTTAGIRPVLRIAPWRQVAVVAGVAAPALYWAVQRSAGDPDDVVWAMRGFAVLLALGVAFALDDEALTTLAASPTSYARRRRSRITITFALVSAPWVALLVAMDRSWPGVPWIDVSLEAAGLSLAALALAAAAQRRGINEPGPLVAPVLLGLLLVADQLSAQWPLMEPIGPAWGASHRNWAILAIISITVLLATGRDPARNRHHPIHRVHPRTARHAPR